MDKVWLVTGSASGLGRNIAEAVLESGDRLVATARDPRRLDDLANKFGERVRPGSLDVANEARLSPPCRNRWKSTASARESCEAASTCAREEPLYLRVKISRDHQRFSISIGGEKAFHFVVAQLHTVRPLINQNSHWRIRSCIRDQPGH